MATKSEQIGLTAEQSAARAVGIGGSDMAAILGVSKWKTARALYHEKRHSIREAGAWDELGLQGEDDGLPADRPGASEYRLRMGHRMEDVLAAEYEIESGRKTRRDNITRSHKSLTWLKANRDRAIQGEKRGLEIKTVEWFMAGDWHDADREPIVPEYYIPQVATYMAVFDLPVWDVFAGVSLSDFHLHSIERDMELEAMMLDSAADFWALVVAGTPPEFDYEHATTEKTLAQLYPGTDGTRIDLPEVVTHLHEALAEITKEASALEITRRQLKNRIGAYMGQAAQGILPGGGGYSRKEITRAAHEVAESVYMTMRYSANLGRKKGEK